MDPVTHGLIGTSAAASASEKKNIRYAALAGGAAAMLPDLDVLISSAADPLLQLEFHRQFSHSLLFIPVGALIAAGLVWWIFRKNLTFKEIYLYSLLGIATAGLADACTSYGVQLLWPFTATRFNWNLTSVFDPLFSLGLVLALGLALYQKNQLSARIGLSWLVLYLLFGLVQRERAETAARNLAAQRNHPIEQLIIKPTIANELLWSIRYVSGDTLHADGVRLLPFAEPDIYEGESAPLLNWQKEYTTYEGTTLYRDIRRFAELSDGVLIRHPEKPLVIGDGRYAMLPISVEPLWGIRIDTTEPGSHVEFKTYRNTDQQMRKSFWNMLTGDREID